MFPDLPFCHSPQLIIIKFFLKVNDYVIGLGKSIIDPAFNGIPLVKISTISA